MCGLTQQGPKKQWFPLKSSFSWKRQKGAAPYGFPGEISRARNCCSFQVILNWRNPAFWRKVRACQGAGHDRPWTYMKHSDIRKDIVFRTLPIFFLQCQTRFRHILNNNLAPKGDNITCFEGRKRKMNVHNFQEPTGSSTGPWLFDTISTAFLMRLKLGPLLTRSSTDSLMRPKMGPCCLQPNL